MKIFKTNTSKILLFSGILGVVILLVGVLLNDGYTIISQESGGLTAQTTDYVPISGSEQGSLFEGTGSSNISLSKFLENAFIWGIAITVILAFLFIVLGSVQYMTTDAVFDKQEGLQKIQAALAGLILALVSWLILSTINPQLLETDITENIGSVSANPSTNTQSIQLSTPTEYNEFNQPVFETNSTNQSPSSLIEYLQNDPNYIPITDSFPDFIIDNISTN